MNVIDVRRPGEKGTRKFNEKCGDHFVTPQLSTADRLS